VVKSILFLDVNGHCAAWQHVLEKPTARMLKIKRTTPTPDPYKCMNIKLLLSTVWFPPTVPSSHTVVADTFETGFPSPHFPPTPNPRIWNDRFCNYQKHKQYFYPLCMANLCWVTNWLIRRLFYSIYKYDIFIWNAWNLRFSVNWSTMPKIYFKKLTNYKINK